MNLTTLAAGALIPSEITQILVGLGVMLGLARLLGELARRFQMPSVIGEILAGVVLGPTLLGVVSPDLAVWLFPTAGSVNLAQQTLVILGVTLLLLVAGLEVDLGVLLRQGRATVMVSLMGMILPFAVGFGLAWILPGYLGLADPTLKFPFALFVGIALSITALPVIVKILIDLNLSKSDLGALIMSSAMINDLIGWIGFAMVLAMLPTGGAGSNADPASGSLLTTIGLTMLFLGLMLTLGRWLAHRALPYFQAHFEWPGGVLVFIVVVAVFSAAFTEWIGIHSIFGAFIAGVALGDSRHLRQSTREHIHQFVTNIFAPIFFASIGLHVNFVASFDLGLVLVVLVVAIAAKLFGGYLGARWGGLERRQSWAVGAGMVARGAMEIILGQIAFQAGLISEPLFVAVVIMALVTSLISGPAIARLVHRPRERKLSDLLSEKHFVPDMRAHTVRQAIDELAEGAAKVCGLDAAAIAAAVWAREQIMHTGIGQMIAVPHARLADLSKPTVMLGRSERGVDFDAPDGRPARLICMLLTPAADADAQIELLDLVARAFQNDQVRGDALDANSYTQLLAALRLGEAQKEAHP